MGLRRSAIALLVAPLAAHPSTSSADSCASCHPDVARAEAEHPHARAGIGCADCHGGDPSQPTKEAAKSAESGYRGLLKGAALVNVCGACHADAARMNPYGLRTDQLALYATSHHGQALFDRGEESVATCASCHGAHGIEGPHSSESPVHPARVPATCGSCHGDGERMRATGLDATIPAAYLRSVHAELLLQKHDLSAPQCASCHGSHGAVPPGFRSVGAVCGNCHAREAELFGQSPHAPLVEEGDFLGCIACHGNHEIQRAQLAILETRCEMCHDGGDAAMSKRDAIVAELDATSRLLDETRSALQESEVHGLVDEDDHLLLDEARTVFQRAAVQQHALDPNALRETTTEAQERLRGLAATLARKREEERTKRLAVVPVALFLAVMSLGFWIRFRRIHEPARGASR